MIIKPEEVEAFERFVDDYERKKSWSRAISLGFREFTRDELLEGESTEKVVQAIFAHLSPEQVRSKWPDDMIDDSAILAYLRDNPQLLIPSGFDEIRIETDAADHLANAMKRASDAVRLDRPSVLTDTSFIGRKISEPAGSVAVSHSCTSTFGANLTELPKS